ncbi:hypothetical protein V6Z11_A08G026300, partial [Gossypium hirsutum]
EVVAISVLFVILQNSANAKPQVPCYFIFGDSLSDNGNNNNLNTLAKVNYSPYGIDFPKGPTGRFSNGKNMQDYIAEYLGFTRSMPPFAESKGENILNGVNYASGAAGIRDETGKDLTLYNNGARKFAVYGLSLIGCAPFAISEYGTNGSFCVDKLNNAAALFNEMLMPLIHQLNNDLPYAKFTYLTPSPNSTTFVTNGTCCTIGGGGGELCLKNSKPCSNRGRFLFWDGFHPTEAWNEKVAERAYSSESSLEANPFNIHKLAKL